MNVNNLFVIADAAKHIQAYDIANSIFAVLAKIAIDNKSYGSTIEPDAEAKRINFQIEMEGDDLIESLSDQDGAGYYDLPRLVKWGEKLMGTNGRLESHALCIPLPLVSRYFCNMIVRLMNRETHNMGGGILDRPQHQRQYWRLGHDSEKTNACYRDLWRRFREEVSQENINLACSLILRQQENQVAPVFSNEDEEMIQHLGPSTLKLLVEDVEEEMAA